MPGNDGHRARPNELLEALSRPHRRRVLCLLGTEQRSARDDDRGTVGELAHCEGSTVVDDPNVLLAGLSDCPFPNLVEWGYLRWDGYEGTVRRGPRFEELVPLLEHLHGRGTVVPDG